ncbi:acetyl-CoA carboxylase carboxyltransferase subunit alpha [Candidatus Oleimmundimicrobium sp.]|uniref:acetyl-CoA carboxylase carboxyltransferase subunit alpha n=1 Tax=Candidatus Oleimmundimicrobium sp. TaxID=3060597 RepID=UPI0027174001|nr:acetyl-CoA carboxylase carboxyltransferase subunit alpha [Candidatus Oleimmundimicrobium sp.]MDO8886655.1 acetyl-CoA carboxylase carboxyltransferase subunit alpha [Candidatus Oleimmundimicrobium sp.]
MIRFMMDFEKPLIELEVKLEELKRLPTKNKPEIVREIRFLEEQIDRIRKSIYTDLSVSEKIQIARHPNRPRTLDYVNSIFSDFIELHGDRLYGEDLALVGGPAFFGNERVMVLGHQKGKNTKENVARNFGMPHPKGFRKALRLMNLAEKFHLPLFCFIDTPGAYPGIEAEEHGQAVAIANNLMRMSNLKVPIIAVNIGEGGSGGALAIGVGDRIFMFENSYYSVITPEGCASILWHDETRAPEAAEALKLTAQDLLEFKIIDGVVEEPLGGAHRDFKLVASNLVKVLTENLTELKKIPIKKLLDDRYKKLRKIGVYTEK